MDRAGTWQRSAALAITPATASKWRSTSAPNRSVSGPGCHSVAWGRNAGEFGDVETPHVGFRHSYPFGIVVNQKGKRFLDEGADFRGYTYAKYGRIILQQPGSFAWQVFDSQVKHLLRDEYSMRGTAKVQADTLEQLAVRMQDVESAEFLTTLREYNTAVKRDVPFDPNIKDGRRIQDLRSTRRTGPIRSRSHLSKPIRSAAGSPSRSAA